MIITLNRLSSGKDSTIGVLRTESFTCFTCEDEYRAVKVQGETRIPSGTYEIKLRNEGAMNQKYKNQYPEHKGMLWLQNVPGFDYIYIHTGNTDDHTEGCILVGFGGEIDAGSGGGYVNRSAEAYRKLYSLITPKIAMGEMVRITVND